MQKHEHYEELCALAALGQLSEEEYETLTAHVENCGSCRDSVEKFSLVLNHLPDDQVETSDQRMTELHETSYRERFLSKAEREGFHFSKNVRAGNPQSPQWHILPQWMAARIPVWITVTVTAVLLFISVFVSKARFERSMVANEIPKSVDSQPVPTSISRSQPNTNTSEEASRAERTSEETLALKSRILALEAALQLYKSKDHELDAQLFSANAQLATAKSQFFDKQTSLDGMNAELLQLRTEIDKLKNNHALDVASLIEQQEKINGLSAQLAQQRQVAEQEQQLSAAAGDVRQMMGARNLHILDVYDINAQGKARKSFGRIYYQEGKSLLFYAFDLAQKSKSGITKVSFQAWGQRESGGAVARNLGIFTLDDGDQQRWVLRIDDPKKFTGIDSLFVTVERHGGADKPTGQKLLYAYLGTPANHP